MNFNTPLALFQHLIALDEQRMSKNLTTLIDESHEFYDDVIALISAHEENKKQTSFNELIGKQAEQLVEDNLIHELVDTQIGVYKLVRKLGHGGMGAVYLGERNDGQLDQRVAIKFVYPSIAALAGKYFLNKEAQHLANLEHVNIAKIFTVDKTNDSLPYMVMEYVDGMPIDDYCKSNNLDLNARLKLFQKVCNAVNTAHQNMVIHADIKPSNILVDNQGEPKLMDFGIARTINNAIEDSDANRDSAFGAASKEFASPEQLEGTTLTTASDVYSLGKVLAKIVKTEPKDAEVNFLIKYSTERELKSRLESVASFSQLIETYLSLLPLPYYRTDPFYRYKKWFLRAPSAAISSIILPAILIIVSVFVSLKNSELEQASIRNKEVLDYYEGLLGATSPQLSKGAKLNAADLLSYGAVVAETDTIEDIETKERVLLTLAKSLFNLGYNHKAKAILLEISDKTFAKQLLMAKIEYSLRNLDASESLLREYYKHTLNDHDALLLLANISSAKNEFSEANAWLDKAKVISNNQQKRFQWAKSAVEISMDNDFNESGVLLDKLKMYADNSQRKLWYNLYLAKYLASRDEFSEAKSLLSESINSAEKLYSKNNPDLAKMYEIAWFVSVSRNDGLATEIYLNKQKDVYQNLFPNYQFELLDNYSRQFDYYFNANMHAQSKTYNKLAIDLCKTDSTRDCEELLRQRIQMSFILNDHVDVIETYKTLTKSDTSYEELSYLIKSQLALNFDKDEIAEHLIESKKLAQKNEQRADYISNLVSFGNSAEAIKLYDELGAANLSDIEIMAFSNAFYAHGNVDKAEALLNKVQKSHLNDEYKQTLSVLLKSNSGKIIDKKTPYLYRLENGHTLINSRRGSGIISPKQGDQMKIGVDFPIKWDPMKLQGKAISIYINQKKDFTVDGFSTWKQVQSIHWHLAAEGVENNGLFNIDPFYFMANGVEGFKVLLVTELGYWSISDGLFSVFSGISKDNGLEHNIAQDLLVDVISKPVAYEVYNIGERNTIEWNELRLGGDKVAIYVLHDDARNIGNKLHANSEVILKRRWYMVANNAENTGTYSLDPSQFNGQGNNYKILIISSNGKWAVSDQRFTVVNPY